MRFMGLLALLVFASSAAQAEPFFRATSIYGYEPTCSSHDGERAVRSNSARFGETTAFFVGMARTEKGICTQWMELHIDSPGRSTHRLVIDRPVQNSFNIASFSPNGSSIVVNKVARHNRRQRDSEFAMVSVDQPARIEWLSPWDLSGWSDCRANAQAVGFLADGRVALEVDENRSLTRDGPRCVDQATIVAIDLTTQAAVNLPPDTKIESFGDFVPSEFRACRGDPDIVSECFGIRGRLTFYNGSPTVRIWPIGTKRLLGVPDDFPVPGELMSKAFFGTAIFANFQVCPLTSQRAGEMQRVCVDSMTHTRFVDYRDDD